MAWQSLESFRDPSVPKLNNLRRAARAGLTVPRTVWAQAADRDAVRRLPEWLSRTCPLPWIVRSGSPTEDTERTSNAGQLVSVVVETPDAFANAVEQVVAALPQRFGVPLGAVFVQPLVRAEVAGITFFDGFYYEETRARESNVALTSGQARGHVMRGHLMRGDAHHAWLLRLYHLLGRPIDAEWALPPGAGAREPVLLQVRPALFPVRRCETLSLANHKEILGDPPSPWIVGAIAEVGRPAMRFFERVDRAVAAWDEPYAIELGERGWLNFSAFFRLMDRWGMPRTMVTDGVGGEAGGPADEQIIPGRLIRSLPILARLALACFRTVAGTSRGIKGLEAELEKAGSLLELHRVNVRALDFTVRTNFAIMTPLAVLTKIRKALGLERATEVVTQRMMTEYAALAARPSMEERLRGLDDWLAQYGHRGPLESDPSRPRFCELRGMLAHDLARGPAPEPPPRPELPGWQAFLARPLCWLSQARERFRDRTMRWWQVLRARILAEARQAVEQGWIETVDDVFFLRSEDLAADPRTWRECVQTRRQRVREASGLDLPATAPRDVIEGVIAHAAQGRDGLGNGCFHGIGLGHSPVLGTAVRAAELTALLNGVSLPDSPILVVDTLEPSWAIVFPRFSAVVAELGGELSHASILLREAGIPAVVNARGAYHSIADGDLLRVDPAGGAVHVEARDGACV